jgi:penicillin-binding protein 1A
LISLRKALTLSKNAVAIRIYEYLGSLAVNPVVEKILQFNRDGRENVLPREATVALGTFPVSPYEMARGYAVFASGGKEVYPRVISYVTDAEGVVLADYRDEVRKVERKQLIHPETAEIMTSLLHDVVEKGTGKAARLPGRYVSGKTGTTNRNTDAWFVGYTPEMVTAVHIGYDMVRSLGPGGTGGSIAAPVWGRYMYRALRGDPVEEFDFSESKTVELEICAKTGLLPGPDCKETIKEIFAPGTEPRDVSENEPRGEILAPFDPASDSKEEIFSAEDF